MCHLYQESYDNKYPFIYFIFIYLIALYCTLYGRVMLSGGEAGITLITEMTREVLGGGGGLGMFTFYSSILSVIVHKYICTVNQTASYATLSTKGLYSTNLS